ncbi:MAG: helix-turn-helix domain-containing protein [Treponema sp.]
MEIPLESVFRENLRHYRKNAKLSQEKLSALIDKNINYINMIESGKSLPSIKMIEKIAEILKIEPYRLFKTNSQKTENSDILNLNNEKIIAEAANEISKKAADVLAKLLK